jgi:hypothetical protein
MQDLRFKGATTSGLRSLLQSNVSDFGETKLERDLDIVGKHEDRPRLSELSARRIELYEWNLEQLDVCVCTNCGRRLLVDRPPANATTWKCDKCRGNAMLLTEVNHMDPAPCGRPLKEWLKKEKEMREKGEDVSWLPRRPPKEARYPQVYYEATLAETMLVTRFRTVMSIRHMPLYHKKYRGHTISSMQHLGEFLGRVELPIKFSTVAFMIVRLEHDSGRKHQDYRVRKAVIIELLKWLPMLLPEAYADVILHQDASKRKMIDEEHLEELPDDDYIYDQLPFNLYEGGEDNNGPGPSATGPMMAENVTGSEVDMDNSGFAGKPPAATNSEAAHAMARAVGEGRAAPRVGWATASTEAECEWEPGYVVRAFPLRFTVEVADLNNKKRDSNRQENSGEHKFDRLSPEDYFYSLLWFWDKYAHCYPFANDPRFKYLAHNLAARRRTLQLANVFTRQLPAGMTREQVVWQLEQDNLFTVNKLQARMSGIKGTAQYIIAERNRICCWVLNGLVEHSLLPHIFLTTSEAELHDPFLHRLLDKVLPSETDLATQRYHGQVRKYHGIQPPPEDALLRRKLAVRDNLHLVTDFYVRKTRLLHHFILQPLFDVDSYAARFEFAQRRTMSHTHELLRLKNRGTDGGGGQSNAPALDPSTRPPMPTMEMCFAAMRDPSGEEARQIVAFAAWMTLSAIHPKPREAWPEDMGGSVPVATANAAGNAALRCRFSDLNAPGARDDDEAVLSNRVLCHRCGSYCLKPVVSKRTGKPVLDDLGQPKKACRFRPDEKEKHSCKCPHCSADLLARLEVAEGECLGCESGACDCGSADCGCKTVVWQLPNTFRFELRYSRNLGRLQIHVRPLTHALRANYDIQFVIDYASVIDYIVKYMGKQEGKSDTYLNMMSNVFKKSSNNDATMAQLCAAAMNEVIGKRDYSDTEVAHLLNGLPLMEFSD